MTVCWGHKEEDEEFNFGRFSICLHDDLGESDGFSWGRFWAFNLAKVEGGGLRFKAYPQKTTPCEIWFGYSAVEGLIDPSFNLDIQKNDIPEQEADINKLLLDKLEKAIGSAKKDMGELYWKMQYTIPEQ